MKLYGAPLSPFVMRVLLVARAKGTDLPLSDFDGDTKSPAYRALNPMGKIPLLVDGDLALPESKVIADYLDAVLPGPALVPADPRAAAKVRLLERIVETYVQPELGALFRGGDDPVALAAAIERSITGMRHLAHFRDAGSTWLAGDDFTVADAVLMPLAFFHDAFAHLGSGAIIAADPGIAAWWDRAKASPLGARSVAEQGAGMKAMMAARAAAA